MSAIDKLKQDVQKIVGFFNPDQIKSARLVYRASENEFLAEKFHNKCDKIPHVLVVC